ncbi:inner membrane CreD family protein [Leptospira stimsonii]|nr:inner membrane CreD family protein [Leptospira stimsonii]RHX85303.1 hypothetical protein DLM78_14420 [Leptospira stimsonii]
MTNDRGENESILRYAHFILEDFQINGSLKPEKRYGGIYAVALYQSDLEIRGSFSPLD